MSGEWKVYDIHSPSTNLRQQVIDQIGSIGTELVGSGSLKEFFYNKYTGKGYCFVRFGFHDLDTEGERKISQRIDAFEKEGKITKADPSAADERLIDGVVMDRIKCVAREVKEVIAGRLQRNPTPDQLSYLIHFFMNQLCFRYDEELQVYRNLAETIEGELRKHSRR